MMSMEEIKQIEDLILLEDDKKIVDQKIKRLTAPGENYGSLMYSVDITVETQFGNEEINLVAKTVPPNEFIQTMFNTQVTFRNEIGFYNTIVPTLQAFQREHGVNKVIDFFPQYYGSRLNLNYDDNTVDSDAILLLENLKVQNFINVERTEGFDLETSKLIMIDLAYLHAVPLALKLQKPEVFDAKIKKYLTKFQPPEGGFDSMIKKLTKLIDSVSECIIYKKRILKAMENPSAPASREPFATVTHNDCWVNNTMVKFQGRKPIKNKLVDFQICDYGSPARDIIFFLFSSVQTRVLERYYNDLLKLYHKTFSDILMELKCDTTPFSFAALEKEIDWEAKNSQFLHVILMLSPIFAVKGSVKEISELKEEDMGSAEATDLHKQKLAFVVKEFAKRNWI